MLKKSFSRVLSLVCSLAVALAFVVVVPGCGGSKTPDELGTPGAQKETKNRKKMQEERDSDEAARKGENPASAGAK